MKQSLKSILSSQIILIPAIFLAACSSPFNSNRATEYQIPWRASDGNYKLQNVEIKSLSDPAALSSPLVRLFVTPSENNGELAGPPAVGRFMTSKDGIRIPLDFTSMQGAAIHAHFERINDFDRAVGVDHFLSWPLQIAVETEVIGKKEISNNAFYDGARNAILILPFTDHGKKGLPLSLNGGVLAHEHFHAIFDRLVLKRLTSAGLKVSRKIGELAATEAPTESSSPTESSLPTEEDAKIDVFGQEEQREEFNNFLLRAMNEGLADFWAWLQSEDTDFVGRSIKGLKECRTLDKGFSELPNAAVLKMNVFIRSSDVQENQKRRDWMYYQVGAQYARFFKELATSMYGEKPSFAERVEMAQVLVRALQDFSQTATSEFKSSEIAPDKIAHLFTKNLAANRMNRKSCHVLAEFASDGAELPSACSQFKISRTEVDGKKLARREKSPPLDMCECKSRNKNTGLCESS